MQSVHYFILLHLFLPTLQFTQESLNFLFHLSLGLTFVWVSRALAQKDSLHFVLSTGRKLFSINALWGWNSQKSFYIIKSDISCGPWFYWHSLPFFPEMGIVFMATSISLWVGPALAGELQSIPAAPRTRMDTFMPQYCFYQPKIHISYFILGRCNTPHFFWNFFKELPTCQIPS